MLYKLICLHAILVFGCTRVSFAELQPTLGEVLTIVTESAIDTGSIRYKGSCKVSIWDAESQSWLSPPVDTTFSILFDHYFWGKFYAKLSPVSVPWTNGASAIFAQHKEVAFDGEKFMEIIKAEGNPMDLRPKREGSVKLVNSSDLLPIFRLTGAEFNLYNLRLLSDKTIFEYPELVSAIAGNVEKAGDLKGCVRYTLPFSGRGAREILWIDPENGFAMKQYEIELLDKDGNATGSTITYTVSAFKNVAGTGLIVPSEMQYTMKSMGTNKCRYRITLDSAETVDSPPPASFKVEFPAGTVLSDERLGVTFVVGKTKAAAIEAINE